MPNQFDECHYDGEHDYQRHDAQAKLEYETQHPGEHENHENCPKHQPRPRRSNSATVQEAVVTTMTRPSGRKLCTIALERLFSSSREYHCFRRSKGLMSKI
jgi:hypothetical protein